MGRHGRLLMVIALVAVLAVSFLLQSIDTGIEKDLREQHTVSPSEAELGPCPVCAGKAELCSHLPLIMIETGGRKIPGSPITSADGRTIGYETAEDGSSEILVSYSAVDAEGRYHHIDDAADESGNALFRIRGNSSRYFTKHSFRLKMTDSTGEVKQKASLLGMNEGTEWALYGPFLDKTLIRNYMWMNISSRVMNSWVPEVRFCELLIDGEYQGLYVLMEMIEVQSYRVDLTKYDDGDPIPSYLVRIEPRINPEKFVDTFSFDTYRLEEGRSFELLYPGVLHQSESVINYVQTDLNELERLLYKHQVSSWESQIDMESFVNYYILEELLAVNDAFSASTYFYRDARGRLTAGPVWDFNNVLDNFFQPLPEDGFFLAQRGWLGQMMRDKKFVKMVINRYRSLRKSVLSDEYLVNYIHDVQSWLGSAADRSFEVWGWSFDTANLSLREMRTYLQGDATDADRLNPESMEEATEWMEEYMLERLAWLDENIESLLQYCHPSNNLEDLR